MKKMTNAEAMALVTTLTTQGVRARIEERISTLENGERNIALSVVASIRDASGNGVVREWSVAPADLQKEVKAMRADLKKATETTKARIAAERGSK